MVRKYTVTNICISALRSIYTNRRIILPLTKREISGRYQGSLLGLFWSFLNPLIMLLVYTFVFSVIFKAKWGSGSESRVEFAIILFIGLIIYNVFAEVTLRSPSLINSNVNFVKKVVFPIQILPIIALGTTIFHTAISFFVWVIAYAIFFGIPHYTIIYFPLILLPLCLFTLGFSWFLASLGVYLRDLNQVIGLFTTVLMFLSPIFYPITVLPPVFQKILYLNPLTFLIGEARNVLMWGNSPDWSILFLATITSAIIACLGLVWFEKTKSGFADVL